MRDIPDLLESLRRAGSLLSSFVETIPEEKLHRRREPGCWTIAEHVSHLAQVQPMLCERLERFRNEAHPVFVPYIPGAGEEEPATPPVLPMEDALERFDRCRERQVALLSSSDDAAWRKTGRHPEYEHYSLYILARHILMHDYWHMYRMEELWLTRDGDLTRLEG